MVKFIEEQDDHELEDRVRVFADLGNNKIYGKRQDPYGFWYLNYDKGQLPDSLRGAYTTPDKAKEAVTAYLNEREQRAKAKEPTV